MKARVHIFYKDGVFDPQGNTVSQALQRQGFSRVASVRMGKVIDVEMNTTSTEEAKRDVQKMCDTLLVNPVIESYQIELINQGKG
ncbi:MAG: phosphoribosylformylglycinamidine synthase subunit PurS [Deltaproteobacteria bacterium]|nr:phosphoribosylformylglycinamidine synthase subunit PurS [Deltaproteobacteria bacterium]MBI3293118.1 phosphoribosylformylglycinamidine synthase subunit PurS [Deltaproteobacteria bacterium]